MANDGTITIICEENSLKMYPNSPQGNILHVITMAKQKESTAANPDYINYGK